MLRKNVKENRLRTDYDLHEEENDIKNQEEHNFGRARERHGLRNGGRGWCRDVRGQVADE